MRAGNHAWIKEAQAIMSDIVCFWCDQVGQNRDQCPMKRNGATNIAAI